MPGWNPKANDIFLESLEFTSLADQREFVDQSCGDDAELRQQVESLIAAGQKAGRFLEDPAVPAANLGATVDQPITEQAGTQIGPYKLLQKVGEGGMGVVYMAEQKEPVKRRVALKIIKPGMDTHQVVARFEAERQALAMMDHPNIAKVLDAGQTDSGRPYFVMELVNGISVTKYCDQQHLTSKERLNLFVHICQAVQHAHQKGIIHRDLKPSNVLVALYDGKAVPKVIDFGVAKATNQSLTDKTMFTQVGQIVGTLEYMSPEQAQRNQLDVDTRSDIYSLGVILYELLSGETPFDSKMLRSAALEEMLRIIREDEPSKPSTKVGSSESLPSIAANRRIDPQKLGATIRGELDWIVMKALEKDRARRYETASKFAEDVEHYLNDEPVLACPPSAGYRFRKFARRNKAVFGTTAAIAATLIAGIIGTSWQAYRATIAESDAVKSATAARDSEQKALAEFARADEEAEKAKSKAAIAQAVNDFLQNDLLGMAEASKQISGDLTPAPDIPVRTVLDRAAGNIEGRFTDQPMVEAEIRDTIANTYDWLGEKEKTETHRRRALEIRQKHLGPRHPDTLVSMANLASSYVQRGNLDEAEQILKKALEIQQQIGGADNSTTLKMKVSLAWVFNNQGKHADSEKLSRQTWEAFQRINGAEHPNTIDSESSMAIAIYEQRRFAEAESHFRHVLDRRKDIYGFKDPRSILAMSNLGNTLRGQGQLPEAEKLHRKAVELGQASLAENSPAMVGCKKNLAKTLARQGLNVEAEHLFRAVLKVPNLGPVNRHNCMRALVDTLLAQNKLDEAEETLQQFLAVERNLPSPPLREIAGSHLAMATIYHMQTKYPEAIEHYQSSVQGMEDDPGRTKALALAKDQLADCRAVYSFELSKVGESSSRDPEKILQLAQSAVRLKPDAGPHRNILGVAFYRNARWQDAIDAFTKASELDDANQEQFGFFRAMAYWQVDRHEMALKEYKQTMDWLDEAGPSPEQLGFRTEAETVLNIESPDLPAASESSLHIEENGSRAPKE